MTWYIVVEFAGGGHGVARVEPENPTEAVLLAVDLTKEQAEAARDVYEMGGGAA